MIPRVLLPAATTLAAGFLLGWAVAPRGPARPVQELSADLLAYETAVGEALGLRPAQRDDLRVLLFHYQAERQKLLHQKLAEAGEDWTSLDRRFESLLMTRILDSDQVVAAEALSRPSAVAVPAADG